MSHVSYLFRRLACVLFLLAVLGVMNAVSAGAAVPKFPLPVFVTTAGQSPDAYTVALMCKREGINRTYNNLAQPKDLKGFKTLIVVPGHSMKGLGSAGIDATAEADRVKRLLKEASTLEIPVVLIHTGGMARRGPTSDPFIASVLPYAKCAIVLKEGNQDDYFTKACAAKNVPLTLLEDINAVTGILRAMFVS